MLKIEKIRENQYNLSKIENRFLIKSKLFEVFSDQTRLKIIYILKRSKELCVTDLARILGLSISAVSHQLKILENSEIVMKKRRGKIICYALNKKVKGRLNLI